MPSRIVPRVTGYQAGAAPGVAATQLEGGAPRTALAFDRGVQVFDVSFLLTVLEYSVWVTFYLRRILKGAVSFAMPMDSGYGLDDHTVTMVPNTYQAAHMAGRRHVLVSFQVWAESQAYEMTDADADALLELYEEYGDQTDALLRRLAQFALVDTLALDF